MRFLIRLVPKDTDRASLLSSIRRIAADLAGRAVNPKWTSYGALELDVFLSSHVGTSRHSWPPSHPWS